MIRNLLRVDLLLLLPATLLSSVGLLMIYSISFDSDPSIFVRQLLYVLFSIMFFVIASRIDFKTILHLYPLFYISLIAFLVLTFIIGVETRGSTRWIDLGFVRLQASELAKPVLILSLAFVLTKFPPLNLKRFFLSAVLVS